MYRESCISFYCSDALSIVSLSWVRNRCLKFVCDFEAMLRSLCMYLRFSCNLKNLSLARYPLTNLWILMALSTLFYLICSFSIAFCLSYSISLFFLASADSFCFPFIPLSFSFYCCCCCMLYLCRKSSKVSIFSAPFFSISSLSLMYSCRITSKGFTSLLSTTAAWT